MALWIKTDSQTETVTPQNGTRFTLEELQNFVGGYIEPLTLKDGSIMWLNEEGKLNQLPYNPMANRIAHEQTGIAWDDGIVGNVLIATRAESGDEEED